MRISELSDEELIKEIERDHWDAFNELYRRYSSRILSFYRKRIDSIEAEDLTQKCFEKIYEKARTYKQSYPAAAWLFTIARNLLIDTYRKNARVEKLHDDYQSNELMDQKVSVDEVWNELQSNMTSLDLKQQQVLQLRYREGRDFDEIGAALNTSEANARQLVSRAVKSLRDIVLEEKEYE